jgi:hypothetical protein
VQEVLERFGHRKVFKELNISGIHCLENIFTLNSSAYYSFNTLQLWLEPVQPVSNSPARVNWRFTWVSSIYPTPTNSVRLIRIL